MHTHTPRITPLARLLLAFGCTAAGLVSTAHAEVQGLNLPVPVAQEPIGRGTGLPPNVMLIFDDSSSMWRRFTPDNLADQFKKSGISLPGSIANYNTSIRVPPAPQYNGWSTTPFPSGHAFSGRMWFDSHTGIPVNTIRFNPAQDYLIRATGQMPDDAGNLPRNQDTTRTLIENRGAFIEERYSFLTPNQLKMTPLLEWMDWRARGANKRFIPLPPFYVLRHNEQFVKQKYGGEDNARKVENYFIIDFMIDKNTMEYSHAEVRAMDSGDNWDEKDQLTKDFGDKPWPESQDFVFTDRDGKLIRKIKPRDLFQNYLTFLAYYNTRAEAMKSAVFESFAQRDEKLRVGFDNINGDVGYVFGTQKTNPNTGAKRLAYPIPVGRDDGLFKGANRTDFFNTVLNTKMKGNTPLIRATHAAAKYYSDATSANSPYKGKKVFSCRQNLAILATDGYYNDGANGFGDLDSTQQNITHYGPNGNYYTYSVSAPYRDRPSGGGYADTLADVAMYYWMNDLVPDSAGEAGKNNVPTTGRDPAFWQHMRTYAIAFGAPGTLDPARPAPGLPTSPWREWPKPNITGGTQDGTAADDLWHASVNSRGMFYSVNDGAELVAALKNILDEANPGAGPGSTNAASSYLFSDAESGEVLQFDSSYNASSLSSAMRACKLGTACRGGVVWDASERLYERLQGNNPATSQRTIVVNTGSALTSFEWGNLSSAQKQALAGGNEDLGKDTVRYLRGDVTMDGTPVAHPDSGDAQEAKWRVRAELGSGGRNVLGMIVHGTPTFIGAPEDIRTELSATLDGYKAFQEAHKDRPTVLYAAANDGMVHAFITERKTVPVTVGGITASRTYEPGDELFAFIPAAAVNKNMRDFTRPPFEHKQHYLLDGELNYSEVKIGNEWKTVLVGSMGAAGGAGDATPAVFALDVTNPGAPKLLWEKTDPAMGQTMGRPVIAPMGPNKWSVFIGSGPNQSQSDSKSAILQIDLETGNVVALQGGGMGSASKGGILGLHVVDVDHDNYADTIYAGDLAGNVWKVSNLDGKAGGGAQYAKLFTSPQPITAPITSTTDKSGVRWLFFGTGKALTDADLTNHATTNVWYGIQDTGDVITDADLVTRNYEVIKDFNRGAGLGTTDAVIMQYTVAGDMDGKKGWRIPLNQSADASAPGYMLLQSRIRNGLLVGQMNFAVPDEPSCDGLNASSRLMVLDPFTGSVSPDNPNKGNIDVNDDGKVDESDLYGGGSGTGGGTGGTGGGSGVPIVGLGFGSGELSGSILIVQQRTSTGGGSGTGGGTPSGNPQDGEGTLRTCALDSNGVRVCLPPSDEGTPPTAHTWTELRYDDRP